MGKPLTISEFMGMFPDDDACLAYLFEARFGDDYACERCGETGKWKKLTKEPAYTCQCGEHVHPMAGTPFHRSHTPLQKWFYAMYLFTTTRHGVPAKELQRQLSVNYKTAWRMGHEIRKYLALVDGDDPLSGHVEADEAYLGGHMKRTKARKGRILTNKVIVVGMAERGGRVMTKIVPDTTTENLEQTVLANVVRGSRISTDEHQGYRYLSLAGFVHGTVLHSKEQYVSGDTHINTIEGFWSLIQRAIKGTHVHVSKRHLAKYLGEFEYRWNLRKHPEAMFPLLLRRLATLP
jgi:transposase